MKKKSIDSVRVKEPCAESWDKMSGNDRVRFCSHCAKNVNDISAMTRREALKLVRRSSGSLCVRYIEHPVTKAPLFAEQLTQITRRRMPLMAAGVVGASLSLASLTYAQGGAMLSAARPSAAAVTECEDKGVAKKNNPSGTGDGALNGLVVDQHGAVIPEVRITIVDKNGSVIKQGVSDAAGGFRFEGLERGTYTLRTDPNAGFAPRVLNDVAVGSGENSVTVELAVQTTMGVVVVLPSSRSPMSFLGVSDIREAIARGEDVNRKEDDGSTSIFGAVEDGDVEAVKLMLEHGAKVNVRDNTRQTPLMMINEETTVEIVELLLQRGAKVNRVAESGDTALIRAARDAKPEVLRALILAGADLNAQNEEGMTALMAAADEDNLENVRVLLESGADVNIRDKQGDNAWDYTAEEEIENLLIAYGIVLDPEDVEPQEETPASGPQPDRSDPRR